MRLRNKIAIITAAGSGSGRSGALIFAREGAKVVVGDINAKAGQETAKMVKDAGGEATFVQIDVGKVDDMRRLIDTTITVYGKIDILWNHAGIPGPGILESTEEEEFDMAMDVNVKGGFFATKFAVPHMIKAGSGSIIFTGSVSSLRATPFSPSYSLAKGGLVPFAMSLAVYLGRHNIRANCICPGGIDSPMLRVFMDRTGKLTDEDMDHRIKELTKKSPMRRLAKPEDIAYAALFLASDEASYVNGAILPVDGGMMAQF